MGSTGKAAGSGQVATNAKFIEHMNEAQIDKEIAKEEKKIANAEKVMGKVNIIDKGMQEAFPLGAGGMTQAQIKKMGKKADADAKKAAEFVKAKENKDTAQKRLEALQDAKKQIAGTGKTLAEVKEEKKKKETESAGSTLKWKTTQKGGWTATGGYQPKVMTAGNIEIHGSQGFYRVFKNGKLVGTTNKLSEAKVIAEKVK